MKTSPKFLINIIVIALAAALSGCVGEKLCYQPGFTFRMPGLTIIHPQDSFDLYDTVWIKMQVPASLINSAGSCTITDSSMLIRTDAVVRYGQSAPYTALTTKAVFFTLGSRYDDQRLILVRQGNQYEADFGLLVDDSTMTAISAPVSDLSDTSSYITTYPDRDSLCRHSAPMDHCPLYERFYIQTTFQGGQRYYPFAVRR